MADNAGSKKRKAGLDDSPDKCHYVLNKQLDVCGKCNKKCEEDDDAIQCDLCRMWVHTNCDNVSQEQYKAINTLSEINNCVYYCNINDCLTRLKSIINDWMIHQAGLPQPDLTVSTLSADLEQLASAHCKIEKAVSDLSNKIETLQLQETKLVDQIQTTSNALDRHTANPTQQVPDRKSNVVLYGIGECSSRTSRHERQQNDVKAVLETLSSIKVQINPDHVIDCFRLGKFKQNQSRPRPILIKLQRTMDVNTILANKSSLPSPLIIKPDMSPQERAIESVLLKERWSLIKAGHNRKQIKLSNNRIFVNNQLHGEVINAVFKYSSSTASNSSAQPMDITHTKQPRSQEQSS